MILPLVLLAAVWLVLGYIVAFRSPLTGAIDEFAADERTAADMKAMCITMWPLVAIIVLLDALLDVLRDDD